MIQRLRMRSLTKFTHHLHNIHPTPRAENAINAGDFLSHLCAIALRKTAGRDQYLVITFGSGKFAQDINGFLFCRPDKPASIDDEDIGTLRIIHSVISVAEQKLCHGV